MDSENIMIGVIKHMVFRILIFAEKIVRMFFMKAWTIPRAYNASKGRFFTWILNIARNAAYRWKKNT